MKNALGLIEIRGLATAILVADTMVKTANVTINQIEKTRGHGWITVKITGDVAAVNAAVTAGKQVGETFQHYISSKVIPRPADSVEDFFCQTVKKEDGKTPPDSPKSSAPNTPGPEPEPEALEDLPEEPAQKSEAVPQPEETISPEHAQEAAEVPAVEADSPEPTTVPPVEEVILPEPEAIPTAEEPSEPVPQTIQPEPAEEPKAALSPPAEESKSQNLPEAPTVNESAVSQLEITLPETKPEPKAKTAGKTRTGKSASTKSAAPKSTVVKGKGTAKQQTGNSRGQKKNNP